MSSAALEVQTAIFAILDADVTLSALVTGVFDDVPESYTDFPYVTLGEDVLTEFDTDGVLGFRVSVTIHCWSQYKGQRETKLVQDAIYQALHHAALSLPSWSNVLTRQVDQTSERDPDGMTRHGVQTLELLVRDIPALLKASNPDLLAFWDYEGITTATLIDRSGNGNDGTITGAVAVPSVIGDGLSFNGNPPISGVATRFVVFDPVVMAADFTVSIWVDDTNETFEDNHTVFADVVNDDSLRLSYRQTDGNVLVGLDVAVAFVAPASAPARGEQHIVLSRAGTVVSVYLNNVLIGTPSFVGVGAVQFTRMGAVTGSNSQNSQSTFDQTRIFGRASTVDEVSTLFREGA
jgi:hypothetical protein